MKKFTIFIVLLFFSIITFSQSPLWYHCTYGFTYEMSQQESWGHHKPVILSVSPLSSAAEAGLQPNDIIETINGNMTKGEKLEIIDEWMHDANEDVLQVTISNLKEQNRNVTLHKKCSFSNMVSEKDLASSYAFYSLEDIQKRSFVCPFRTTFNADLDIVSYKTFGYDKTNNENVALDNIIIDQIVNSLQDKGLIYTNDNPEMVIRIYYSYNHNQNYRSNEQKEKLPIACRYNVKTKKMEYLPIYDMPSLSTNQAPYSLKLGIQLIDNKSNYGNRKIIWECESNEFLNENYGMENYSKFHIPLMMMQFPFAKTKDSAKFFFQSLRYNYTGINYNLNDMEKIISVEENSPAAKAGLRTGDKIEKINKIRLEKDQSKAEEIYRRFVYNSFEYRDLKTQFVNAYGFEKCAYWDKLKYTEISKTFKMPEYEATFSYLFYFEPFINPSGSNVVNFNIKREKEKLEFSIWPSIKIEESFETIR